MHLHDTCGGKQEDIFLAAGEIQHKASDPEHLLCGCISSIHS
jgi:hypothetical protein